jgi:hypothetical protein
MAFGSGGAAGLLFHDPAEAFGYLAIFEPLPEEPPPSSKKTVHRGPAFPILVDADRAEALAKALRKSRLRQADQ